MRWFPALLGAAALAGACAEGSPYYGPGSTGTGGAGGHGHADGGTMGTGASTGSTASSSTSTTVSSSSTSGGTCNSFCGGCACPSTECTMCCVQMGLNDVCTNKMCGCF